MPTHTQPAERSQSRLSRPAIPAADETNYRHMFILLQWVLFAGTLQVVHLGGAGLVLKAVLVGSLGLLNFGLAWIPVCWWREQSYRAAVVLFDLAVLTVALWWLGESSGDLYLTYFIVLAAAAVSGSLAWGSLITAGVVLGYGALLYVQEGSALLHDETLLLRLPLLFMAGLMSAFVAARTKGQQRQSQALRELIRCTSVLTATCGIENRSGHSRYQQIVALLHELIPGTMRASLVRLVNDELEVLVASDAPELDELRLDRWRYPELQEAFTSGKPVIIDDLCTDPLTSSVAEQVKLLPFSALLVCPVLVSDPNVSHFALRVAQRDGTFTPEHADLCSQIAEVISFIYRHLELHSTVQEAKAEVQVFADVVSNIQLGICVWQVEEAEGRVETKLLAANEAAARIMGRDLGWCIGREIAECFPTHDELGVAVSEVINTGMAIEIPKSQQRDGTHLSFKVFPLPDTCIGLAIEDVSERVEAQRALIESQDQLRQSQKMEAVGQLAGGIAHDFNNLLTGIIGFTKLASQSGPMNPSAKADLERVCEMAHSASGLTRQLLAFSRQQPFEPTVLELGSTVERVTKLLERVISENVELRLVVGSDSSHVLADQTGMEQVLLNLAVNARDAMQDGGQLTLETTQVTLSIAEARSRCVAAGGYARLSVTDTGCGISDADRERIFEPFFTTKNVGEGTGLGLSTVYGIVQQHQGYIQVESEVGHGTAFHIFFPLVDAELTNMSPRPADVAVAQDQATTVLLVEDEDLVRNVVERTLSRSGFHVIEASGADEAEQLFVRKQDEIGLLLTDIVMPGGSGVDLYRRLVERCPELKVLLMSGYPDKAVPTHEMDHIDAPLIMKPFTPEVLSEKVREVLAA